MANPNYTVLFYDALTAEPLDTIPINGLTFGSQLNQPMQLSGTFDPVQMNLSGLDVWTSTAPSRVCICVDYGGELVWGGLNIVPRQFTLSQRQSTPLAANELWSYFTRRILATDYSAPPYSGIYPVAGMTPMPIWNAQWTNGENPPVIGSNPPSVWDPMLVAGQLISDAMQYSNVPNGGSPIAYGTLLGGMSIFYNGYSSVADYLASENATSIYDYINITYPFTSLNTVDSTVTQLSQLGINVGIDFAVDIGYSAGTGSSPVAAINLSTPLRGRPYSQTNLTVDTANCYDYTVTEAGDQTAWQIYERGGSGAIDIQINVNPQEAGYPLLESVQDHSYIVSGNIMQILGQVGISDEFIYSYPPASFSVVLDPSDPACPLGSFVTGDNVWLKVQPDSRFPNGFQGEWRITAWNVNVADAGAAKMTLTLNQPPALVAIGPAV